MKIIATICLLTILAVTNLNAQDSLYLYTVFHGENDQDQFGVVENVGDVNGDGFEDLIVGAPAYITGAVSSGYAKLYFGGADFDTLAEMTFRSYENKKGFGYTIAGNGDLNGDGYSDFAIADPTFGDLLKGKVYVYFGGPQLDTIPDLTLIRDPNDDTHTFFGHSMSMKGDLNFDGFSDLVVSAPRGFLRYGEVHIYFGGINMTARVNIKLIYPKDLQQFGECVEIVGDVNQDNIDDLVVSSNPVDSDTTTFIFFGNKENNIGFNNFYIFNEPLSATVSRLGDINGDGNIDFAVGNKVFLPPLANNSFPKLTIHNEDNISFGIRSGIPDLNDDGYDDFICLSTKGREENILIVFGGAEASINTAIVLKDPDDKTGFGRYVTFFSRLFDNNVISLVIGDKETTDYTEHGTGKVFIYNNDSINSVGIDEGLDKITDFNISQNYPNPFNPTTKIRYTVYEACELDLIIYDITGKEINRLFTGYQIPGSYEITWEGVDNNKLVASGVYFLRVSAQPTKDNSALQQKVIKLMLLK